MNRSLRKTHFLMVAVLTPVAIGIFAASIAARRTIPTNPVPPALETPVAELQETGRRLIHADGFDIQVRGLMNQGGARFLEFTPLNQPRVADLLAYIGPLRKAAFDGRARLLGPVYATCPVRFALPVDSSETLSEIYLYSGATREVVAHVNLTDSVKTGP